MLSIVREMQEEIRRMKPKIRPPTPETVESLRAVMSPTPDALVEGYAASRADMRTPDVRLRLQQPRTIPLPTVRRVQSDQTQTFGQPELPELYQRRMTSAPVLRNQGVNLALRASAGQVRDIRDVDVTEYGYDPGNPQTWEQANRQAIAEAQKRTAQGVEGVRVRYPGDEETLAQGVGATAGQIGGLLNRELPVLPQVREAAGRVAQPVAEMAVEQTPGLAIAQKIGERVPYYPTPEGLMVGGVEGLVPTRVWEVALELLPGIGTVPGVMSAVRKGNPEAIAAVRRALKDPRAADAIAGARRALQAESGALRMARGPEDLGGAAGGGIIGRMERELFHGTDAEFDVFDISHAKAFSPKFGLWFTDDTDFASSFGRNVKPARVTVRNPKIISESQWNAIREAHAKDSAWFASWKQQLQAQGHDGLLIRGEQTELAGFQVGGHDVVAAFDNSQVRPPDAGAPPPTGPNQGPDQPIRSAQPFETAVSRPLEAPDAALRAGAVEPASEAASRLPGQPPAVGGGAPGPPPARPGGQLLTESGDLLGVSAAKTQPATYPGGQPIVQGVGERRAPKPPGAGGEDIGGLAIQRLQAERLAERARAPLVGVGEEARVRQPFGGEDAIGKRLERDSVQRIESFEAKAQELGAPPEVAKALAQAYRDGEAFASVARRYVDSPVPMQLLAKADAWLEGKVPDGVVSAVARARLVGENAIRLHVDDQLDQFRNIDQLIEAVRPSAKYMGPPEMRALAEQYPGHSMVTHPEWWAFKRVGEAKALPDMLNALQKFQNDLYKIVQAIDPNAAPALDAPYLRSVWDIPESQLSSVVSMPIGRASVTKKRTFADPFEAMASKKWPYKLKKASVEDLVASSAHLSGRQIGVQLERKMILDRFGTTAKITGHMKFRNPNYAGWY